MCVILLFVWWLVWFGLVGLVWFDLGVFSLLFLSVPEIHSHVAGTLSNQQTNKQVVVIVDDDDDVVVVVVAKSFLK